ncbi:hypothetical protein BOX15_Mlig032581g1 [Macrostomum lignano]|uniref:Uncharacterized protein n=1 Tax=Macrostomum lignano TaxID=282301 RepID=A0A267G2P7_9PLAT|nr:hypothetical protein BOX15_Mlig032581g1 [Macrostomum lignano]
MTDHKSISVITQCIRGPSAIKTTTHCHRKPKPGKNGTEATATDSRQAKTDEATFTGKTVEELLSFTNGDLLKASRLLESRLAASRAQIASLTSSNSGSLDASRLAALRAEQRQTLRLCEGLYRLSMDDEDGETKPAKTAQQQLRKSVAFQETKTSSTPASDAFIRSSLAELRSRAELEAAKPPQQPSTTTQKSKSRDDLDATEGETAVRRRYQELLRSRVKAMWSDFDVAGARESPGGWHRRRRSASLDGSLEGSGGARKTKPAPAAASTSTLGRTIPEPFSMTLRESTAGPASLRKSRSLLQFEAERRRQRDEEEAACRVRFHASPVPAHVRMPLFEELSEQQQTRRKEIRERSQERLKEIERPFSFASESAARPEAPRSSAAAPAAAADFRARPVPPTSSCARRTSCSGRSASACAPRSCWAAAPRQARWRTGSAGWRSCGSPGWPPSTARSTTGRQRLLPSRSSRKSRRRKASWLALTRRTSSGCTGASARSC